MTIRRILAWSPVWGPLSLLESWAIGELWFNQAAHTVIGNGIVHFMALLTLLFTAVVIILLIGRALYRLAQRWDETAVNEDLRSSRCRNEFSDLQNRADTMDPENRRPSKEALTRL